MEYTQYPTEESSKPPDQQQYILLRFAKSWEREIDGRWNGQPTQVTQPKLEDPNQKSISKNGVAKPLNPRLSWSNLNEMEPNSSHRYRRPRRVEKETTPKLWSYLGQDKFNNKKVDTCREGKSSPKDVKQRRDKNQGQNHNDKGWICMAGWGKTKRPSI